MTRYRTLVLCVLYVISPIDILPEAALGPFGIPDDLVAVLIGIRALMRKEPPANG